MMKTSLLRFAAVLGLSIGALALPTTAFAGGGGGGLCGGPGPSGQVMNCHFSGFFAEAGYQAGSWNTSETDVSIGAIDGQSLTAGTGAPTEQSSAFISISKIKSDPTNPYGKPMLVVELFGSVPLTSGFSIDHSLGNASLNSVDIPVYGFDENGPVNGQLVTVSATWTGAGAVTRSSFMYSFRSGGFVYQERFSSSLRSAPASSSVAEGTTDWMAGLSPTYADLQSISDATLVVTRS